MVDGMQYGFYIITESASGGSNDVGAFRNNHRFQDWKQELIKTDTVQITLQQVEFMQVLLVLILRVLISTIIMW